MWNKSLRSKTEKRKLLWSLVLLGVLVSLFCTGCGQKQEASNILNLRLKEDLTTLDPAHIVDVAGGAVAAKIYSGLVRYDENYNLVPDLALHWEISPDKRTYTFILRDNCGINADIVKLSFERIMSPEKLSPRAWIFDKVEKIGIVNPYTLEITLKEPYAPFLSLLTMPNAYIKNTGPYRLVEWQHDQSITLETNPDYYGEKPKVSGIEYRVIPEEFTAKTEFELDNLDFMEIQPVDWDRLNAKGISTYSQVGLNTYYLGFNCEKKLFDSVNVRQAFNYAIDKDSIIEHILLGQAVSAGGPVPDILLKNKTITYPYLPNRAEKMLKGVKFNQPLKLYVRAESQAIQIAEIIEHYLSQIGVRTDIVPLEWSAFKEAIAKGEADLFLMSWWADYPDPENFLFPTFHSSNWGSGGNRVRYKNQVLDELIEDVQSESSPEKYAKLQRLTSRQAPWVFLYHKKELFAAQPWIEGIKMYPVYNSDKGTDIIKNEKLNSNI